MDNIVSYALYVLCFIISIFWSYVYEKHRRKTAFVVKAFFCSLIITPILIIQGFRYGVGTDYFSYMNLYHNFAKNNSVYLSMYASEPLFILFCKVLAPFADIIPNIFFIADALLMNILVFCILDYYKEYASMPCMYMFYYTWCFPYFLNIERQGLAVIIIWYAMIYVYQKKPIHFAICVLIATLIHNTAIVGCIFYFYNFIYTRKKGLLKRSIIILGILSPAIFGTMIKFLSEHFLIFYKYRKFANLVLENERINTNFIIVLCLIVVLLAMWPLLKKSKIDAYWILFLCVVQALTYLLINFIDYGFRMSFYFELGLIYGYAYCCKHLNNKANTIALNIFMSVVCLFYFTYKFYVRGNCSIFPFNFFVYNII